VDMGLQDDVIYLGLLTASIAFGLVNKRWLNPASASGRRSASTAFGLFVLVAVAGRHSLYALASYVLQVRPECATT